MIDDVERLQALVDGLVDLFGVVADALEAAENELAQLTETNPPLPDAVQLGLDERLVLLETLHRIREGAKAGKTVTPGRIDATYRDVAGKPHHDPYELPRYPVDESVLEGIRWANGVVERRAMSDRDVDHAIRNATERKWAW